MSPTETDRFEELLNLQLDGQLSSAAEAELAAMLEPSEPHRAEQRRMAELGRLLDASRVEVRADFHRQVMAGLPAAGWEVRRGGGWQLAAATAALLMVAAFALVGLAGGGLASAVPAGSLIAAVGGLLQSSVLLGAGLAAASWTGAGLAVGSLFTESLGSTLAFIGLVVGLDAIFLLLLFGRPRSAVAAASADRSVDR